MKLIKQGAEAKIFLDENKIIKERTPKNYRIKEIDEKLRFFRTKREAKIIEKSPINVPKIFSTGKEKIEMEFIEGDLLKDAFDKLEKNKRTEILKKIGKEIRKLHDSGIIHGDLTTANIILKNSEPFFIDFGLGFFSDKEEDKAVDIYLLKQVIESKHYDLSEEFKHVLEGYIADKSFIRRLGKIESRGRYKNK